MSSFKDQFSKLGGEIVNKESYLQESKDFRTQLTKLRDKKPEVIYFISYPIDGGIAVKQAKEMGIEAIFIGTSGLKANDFISTGGEATEGFVLTSPVEYSSDKRNKFINDYKKRFGIEPGICSDRGYDSVYILAHALSMTNNNEMVKDSLYKIKDFKGVIGNISFDVNGDLTDLNYDLLKVKNGQFVPYEK